MISVRDNKYKQRNVRNRIKNHSPTKKISLDNGLMLSDQKPIMVILSIWNYINDIDQQNNQ